MLKLGEDKDRVYVLCGGKSPLSKYISTRDSRRSRLLYKDPKTNSNLAMRFSKNHPSPFIKDQDDTAIVEPIVFEEGFLRTSRYDRELQLFLLHHPGNVSNGGGIFYEADPERDAQERMELEDLQDDAIVAFKKLDFDQIKDLSRIFLKGNIDKKGSSEIKHDFRQWVKQNPQQFLDALDDSDIEVETIAARAFSESMVTFRAEKDIHYNLPDNKKKIMTVPHGMDKVEALATWLVSNDGLNFYKILANTFESR